MQNNSYRLFRLTALWIVMIMYVAILTKLILFKQSPHHVVRELRKDFTAQRIKRNLSSANLEPLKTVKLYMRSNLSTITVFKNIGGNIIGFIPFGFLLPVLLPFFRKAYRILFAGFVFSLGFESFQLMTGLGHFDVDDLLLNTAGSLIGFVFFLILSSVPQTKNPAVSGTL